MKSVGIFCLNVVLAVMVCGTTAAHAVSVNQVLDVLRSCSAQVTNLNRDQVLKYSVGHLLGSTPAIYGNYCVPALQQTGTTAPELSLRDCYALKGSDLYALAAEISKRSK